MGDRQMLGNETSERILRRFLDAGFKVVSIDYRLAPETKLPAIIEDVKDAFRWVREVGPTNLSIDASRLAAVGHSAGGYLTLMAGSSLECPPQALVAFYGYGDIAGDWYAKPDPFYRRSAPLVTRDEAFQGVGRAVISGVSFRDPQATGRGRFYLYCRQNGRWCNEVAGLDAVDDARQLLPYCPLRNVTAEFPPTMLVHGTDDTDVPYQQSVLMAEELKRKSIRHELVTLKGFGHAFEWSRNGDPETWEAYDRAIAFLKRWLIES
jgi:acetyl esterase/lipase